MTTERLPGDPAVSTRSGQVAVVAVLPDCQMCSLAGDKVVAQFDGKTTFGPWAFMCLGHFVTHGVGLGIGKGQRLVLEVSTP